MPVTGIGTNSTDPQTSSTGTARATSALGKDDFLKLLMAQLGAQDPLSPMDNQQFVAQLAQFSSVEALQAESQRLDALLVAQNGNNQLQAANLVGREATYQSGTVAWPGGGGTMHLSTNLTAPAATVTFEVKDASGAVVHTETRTGCAAGAVDGSFDVSGGLAAGTYTVSVVAADADGHNIPVQPVSRSLIRGVSFESGFAELLLADGTRLKLADVLQVNLPPT